MGKIFSKRFDNRPFVPQNQGRDQITCGVHLNDWMQKVKEDPARLAAVLCDLRRPVGVSKERFGVAAYKTGREPMLNADKTAIERSLSKHFDEHGSKHAKLKMVKRVIVKPESPAAAKIVGTWAEQTWDIWSLKYAPGLVIRTHRGLESDVFPGWGKMKSVIEQIGFKLIR